MTDKMADQITESDQKRSNYGQCENNEECNDSFMSFLVYSFMKNMWRTVHFETVHFRDRPLLGPSTFGTVHFWDRPLINLPTDIPIQNVLHYFLLRTNVRSLDGLVLVRGSLFSTSF